MDRDPFCCIFPIHRAFLLDVPMQLTGPALPAGLCAEIPNRKAISYISLHHVVNTSPHDAMSRSLFTSLLLSPCGSWVERKLEKTFPHPQPKRVLFPQLNFLLQVEIQHELSHAFHHLPPPFLRLLCSGLCPSSCWRGSREAPSTS